MICWMVTGHDEHCKSQVNTLTNQELKRGYSCVQKAAKCKINIKGLVEEIVKYSYTYNSVVGLHNRVTCI